MIIDKSHLHWVIGTAGVLAVSAAGYAAYAWTSPFGPSGGSVPGLLFGIAAAALMFFAFLLVVRRRFLATRIGSARFWMRGHVWLGGLTVPLTLFHSGGRFGGRLEQVLMLIFAVVIVSGLYGLFVQYFLPRLMRLSIPDETFIDQIPYLSRRNSIICDQLVARRCGKLTIDYDPFIGSVRHVVDFAANLPDDEKKTDKWLDGQPDLSGLLWSLALPAKDAQWEAVPGKGMQGPYDFPRALGQIYEFESAPAAEGAGAARAAVATEKPAASSARSPGSIPQRSLDSFRAFYLDEARPFLLGLTNSATRSAGNGRAAGGSPSLPGQSSNSSSAGLEVAEHAQRRFAVLRAELAAPLHEPLSQIERLCDERRQMLQLKRLHRQLHWWLVIHVPASFAVIVLMIVHIVLALRVVPFQY